jgi:hypothetical protein
MAVQKDENVQALVDKISNLPAFDPSNAREFHSNYEEEGLCVSIEANCSWLTNCYEMYQKTRAKIVQEKLS